MRLEGLLRERNILVPLFAEVGKIIDRGWIKWMGDLDKKGSPVYMLKKNYGYDINRNSGFYKKWWQKMLDSIKDNSMGWIVGLLTTILASIVTAIITLD